MKKALLILMTFLMPLCVSVANIYTYKLVKTNDQPADNYVYPNTPNLYNYVIKVTPNLSGFTRGTFEVTLENGKFSDDGKITKKITENVPFSVIWNNIANSGNNYGTVKISAATASAPYDKLIAEATNLIQFSSAIASLKGQIPSFAVVGANPPMGTKQQLTAKVFEDMVYPGIYEKNIYGVYENKKVKNYQWTLPPNWKTVLQGKTGTFITDQDVKEIVVETDYFTPGTINVRAVNDVATAYSEIASQNFDRGFSFTNYPSSLIPFGQTSTYTFAVTPASGVTFEWEVPSGWQINGQGNVLEGVNLNSINVTTSSFCSASSVVRVRLKKDAEVSGWFTCSYPGVSQPVILSTTSPVYQCEDALFSVDIADATKIQSISWSGSGVVDFGKQGVNYKVAFLKSGTIKLKAAVLIAGCSIPFDIIKDVVVNPHRLSVSGPSQICSQGIYVVNNVSMGLTINWGANNTDLNITSGQGTNTATFATTANSSRSTTIEAVINNSDVVLVKGVQVGNETAMIGVFDLKTGNMLGAPYNNSQQYNIRVLLNNAPASSSSYRWEVTSPLEDDNIMIYRGPSFNFGAGSSEGYYHFTLKYLLECGWSTVSKDIYFGNGISSFSLYPNPATNVVTLQLIKEETLEIVNQTSIAPADFDVQQVGSVREGSPKPIVTTSDYEVQFWNEYSGLVHSVKSKESNLQISLKALPKGMYFVHFIKKGEKTQKQILWVK